MKIKIDLNQLVENKILSQVTADQISEFYKTDKDTNWLMLAFGVIGSLLIGLGVILLVAHNWDNMSPVVKLFLVFGLLILAQGICGFSILKKGKIWQESSAIFLFSAVGASIALISQIYHIQGSLDGFIFIWMILVVGLIYLIPSSTISILYLIGTTIYAMTAKDWRYDVGYGHYWYYLLLASVIPHYMMLFKKGKGFFLQAHHWIIPLSIIVTTATIQENDESLLWLVYMALFGGMILIGSFPYFQKLPKARNSYRILGVAGTLITLFVLSFEDPWNSLDREFGTNQIWSTPEFVIWIFLFTVTGFLFYNRFLKKKNWKEIDLIHATFILFPFIYLIGLQTSLARIAVNILLLGIGVFYIRNGTEDRHFLFLNLGMIIISILIICRFIDMDITFVARGIIFILMGLGFFMANYFMLKKKSDGQ